MPNAALFLDLDGTLIDSDPLHARVFVELFAEHGIEIDEAFYIREMHGKHNTEIFRKHLPNTDPDAMHLEKEARFRDILTDMPPIPGAERLIARARAKGWAVAVVTNAPRANANASLGAIGLADSFDQVVIGEECAAGKPDPAPYLRALDLTGASADRAVAFEDSPSGVVSASRAGLYTVGIRSSLSDSQLRAAGARQTLADFTDPALEPVLDRLEGALT